MNEQKNGHPIFKILSIVIVLAIVGFGVYSYLPKEVKVNHVYLDTHNHLALDTNNLDEIIEHMKSITFNEKENSLLITLDNKVKDLKESILNYIDEHFDESEIATFVQIIEPNEHLQKLADEYHISLSKARLIETVQENDPSFSLKDLSSLSTHELFILLYNQHHSDLKGIPYTDLNLKDVKALLLKELDLSETEVESFDMNYDIQDHKLVLVANLKTASDNYTFQLDPKTGSILNEDKEKENYITKEKAISIALENANEEVVNDLDVELKENSEYVYYDIEFEVNQIDYTYWIDAISGNIIHTNFEKE